MNARVVHQGVTVKDTVVWCVTVPEVPAAVAVIVMFVVPVGVEGGAALPQLEMREMPNKITQNAAPRIGNLRLPRPTASADRLASRMRATAKSSDAALKGVCRSERKLNLLGGVAIAAPLTVDIVMTGVTTLRFKV